jgi:hypothetical protein
LFTPSALDFQFRGEGNRARDGLLRKDGVLARSGFGWNEASSGRQVDRESLRLRGADVLASCSPYDQGALERAIDLFLENLGGSQPHSLPGVGTITNRISGLAVAALALVAIEVLRRRAQTHEEGADASGTAEELEESEFPGLPRRWRLRVLEEG